MSYLASILTELLTITFDQVDPIKPKGGGPEAPPPYAFLLTAPKRMLRSIRNFLTFPKYQKQKN